MTISQTAILVGLVLPAGLLQPGGTSAGAPADQIRIIADWLLRITKKPEKFAHTIPKT